MEIVSEQQIPKYGVRIQLTNDGGSVSSKLRDAILDEDGERSNPGNRVADTLETLLVQLARRGYDVSAKNFVEALDATIAIDQEQFGPLEDMTDTEDTMIVPEEDDILPDWVLPIPTSYSEATARLLNSIPDESREHVKKGESFSHHGFGTFIRNSWGLWRAESVLSKWFWDNLKIWHADDMSGIILDSVTAAIKGEAFDLDAAVKRYHAHWVKTGIKAGERPNNVRD